MSAIYGLVRFDGGVDAAQVQRMRDAIAYWGDGGGQHVENHAALGCLSPAGEPAASNGVFAGKDGSTLVATARLDNREELRRTFGLAADVDDRELVAQAWERWGEQACERLYGDWSFASWQPRERRLVLARDHFGNTALYYHRGAGTLLFASGRKALLAMPEVPRRLNELRLAQHLAFWVTDGGATLHDAIFRLPPGHRLVATDSSFRIDRYWHPEALPELRWSDDRQYVEAFLERYDAAVKARLRTTRRVATTLSSGLDSGSVTALAARALGADAGRMTAFTSVPQFPAIAGTVPHLVVDEWPLAHRIAERWRIDDHRRLAAENVSVLGAFERSLFLHDEPEYGAANLHWIIALLEEARDAGAGVLLSGQFGNGGVSWSGDQQRPVRSFLSGHWLDSFRALREWQRNRGISFPRAVSGQIVRPLMARAGVLAFHRGWSKQLVRTDIIAPHFARRVDIDARMRAAGYDPMQILDPRGQQLRVLLPDINPVGATWHEAAAGHGLQIVDPTADVRLLELCLAIPDGQFSRGAEDRRLMRRAMEGILPPEVQWNVRRGSQGADLSLRMRAERDAIDAAVGELAGSDVVREYLDVDSMRSRWQQVRDGSGIEAFAAGPLFARTLLFALFLGRTDFRDGAMPATSA